MAMIDLPNIVIYIVASYAITNMMNVFAMLKNWNLKVKVTMT